MSVKTKKVILTLVLVASIITIIGTVSFAYFSSTGTSVNQEAVISTANVKATFSDVGEAVSATLNFGESFTKSFKIENNGDVPAHVKMYWKDLVNTYTEKSLSYTLSKSSTVNGTYTAVTGAENKLVPQSASASTKLLANDIEVPVGETYYKLTVTLNYLSDVNQDSDLTATFYSWFELQDINYDDKSAIEKIIASSKGTITNFDSPASDSESAGVYELADEGGNSYYFRGPVENNYVRFGKWMDSNHANYGKDMYWRIVRVNGDGSLRLIYAGTSAHSNSDQGADTFIGTSAFNTNYNDAKYVGYMYSPTGTTASTASSLANPNEKSSTIKGVLETWYDKNLKDYDQYISKDAVFCYDRTTPGKSITGWDSDTGNGYGTNNVAFGATARTGVWNSATTASAPNFVCTQNNDKFTSKNSTAEIGNKKLEYPVGLISADEIVAAGSGKYKTASSYYLKRNSWYWSGSPSYYIGYANVFDVYTANLNYAYVGNTAGSVAPVINLTVEYAKTLVGDGTIGNEYRNPNG